MTVEPDLWIRMPGETTKRAAWWLCPNLDQRRQEFALLGSCVVLDAPDGNPIAQITDQADALEEP